jgi:hypothetical protein
VSSKTKSRHEEFARFFEEPTKESLRELLRSHFGETDELDFKARWPKLSSVARHVLAMANSGGGVLIVGMAAEDDGTLSPVGLPELLDKADVSQGIEKFLPPVLVPEVVDFAFTTSEYGALEGKSFQIVFVEGDPGQLPYVCRSNGDGIRRAAIYVRRGTRSVEIDYEDLQALLDQRIGTGHSSAGQVALARHIEDLRILDGELRRTSSWTELVDQMSGTATGESHRAFLLRMIREKRKLVETLLGGY